MTNLIQELQASTKSYVVKYASLLKKISQNSSSVYCLVEGHDSPYYAPRVNQERVSFGDFSGTDFVNCGGQDVLLKIRELVLSNTNLSDIAISFFIDRDFGVAPEYDDCDQTYVTDGYSVEQHYVGDATIKAACQHILFKDEVGDPEAEALNEICRLYRVNFENYLHAICDFNAWYRCVRSKHDSDGKRLVVQPIPISDLVKLNWTTGNCEKTYDIAYLNTKIDDYYAVSHKELAQWHAEFRGCNPEIVFRGKQHADFVFFFLSSIVVQRRRGTGILSELKGKADEIPRNTLLDKLSSYAETPVSLIQYLKTFFEKFGEIRVLI